MNSRKTLSTIIILFIGLVIGIAIFLAIGAVLSRLEPDTLLTDRPKTFGDIKIIALEPNDAKEDKDVGKMLVMAKKEETPFFYVEADKSGKVTNLIVLGENNSIRLTIKASEQPGKWERAVYGRTKDYTTGEQYVDLDFDGQFDAKYTFDDLGKLILRHIYLNGIWKEIDSFKNKTAISDQTTYVFDANSGWRKK